MTLSPIHSSDELIARAVAIADEGRKKRVAVAAAQDVDVIGAVVQAQADGFIEAELFGDASKIRELANDRDIDLNTVTVVDEPDAAKAAHAAVGRASEGKADAIMKGFLPTSMLLKTVLDKQYGLRGDNTLSHCAVLDIPGYHKLLNVTDGGMVVQPTPEQKYQILDNAVLVARALGLSPVKIAISAAVDQATNDMPHTISDRDQVIPMVLEKLKDVVIDSSISLLRASGEHFKNGTTLLGDADVFLVDSIEEGNIVAKSLIQFAQAVFAGVIVGARVPVSLVSRTDTIKNKKASLALACVVADYYSLNNVWGNS